MRLPIPRATIFSTWWQQFLECNVLELRQALQDCADYTRHAVADGEFLRALLYADIWPKVIHRRIAELRGFKRDRRLRRGRPKRLVGTVKS